MRDEEKLSAFSVQRSGKKGAKGCRDGGASGDWCKGRVGWGHEQVKEVCRVRV